MKYTFADKDGKQRTVNIPDDDIKRAKSAYGLSNKEAIDMWLVDEGYLSNPVVEELNAKAKANGVKGGSKKRTVRRKEDPIKRQLIATLFDSLKIWDGIYNAEIRNPERIISFSLGHDTYEITLSKKRK
jgi:hypothetical protein